ncbi:Glycerol kinase [Labeo rohita]|uniref:Glycerol kinase n=1 Tax=Labeo rohita TaxID=84645 RepID=A0ABQ8M799_LABRO|nr:Glycerol kinase [Labeo rohita]
MTMLLNMHCGRPSCPPLLWQLTRAASWACPKIRASFVTITHIRLFNLIDYP